MKTRLIEAAGYILAGVAALFGIACFLQWIGSGLRGSVGNGGDGTFYWDWVWTFWAIAAGVATVGGIGVMLLDIADDARIAEKQCRKTSASTRLEKP